ncbi:MAG: YcaQ family DNA glycosylase [Armatimonadetes bacterium]|nr:YcaQ family DNA glycosylase [Armatimonadota bacterium]
MQKPIELSKADARRALCAYHFRPADTLDDVFARLRSVQFDPIAPAGCNHDLVIQARLAGYKVGDWHPYAYRDRKVYDGWDKCACLIPIEGWPLRRIFHQVHREWFEEKIYRDHADAVEAVLKELRDRGPLMPRDFDFQARREDWKGSWFGPSVTKQVLKALWHSGQIVTRDRKNGQHVYDLAERVIPAEHLNHPPIDPAEARIQLGLERHRAMGMLRPTSSPEIWSYQVIHPQKRAVVAALLERDEVVPAKVEGMAVNLTQEFLDSLESAESESKVTFVAPLDPFMWDRKMIAHLFDFDYIWEIYTPEAKRKWGYYVLPILFRDRLVARIEFRAQGDCLEVREFHFETPNLPKEFWPAFEHALHDFMTYSSTSTLRATENIPAEVRTVLDSLRK